MGGTPCHVIPHVSERGGHYIKRRSSSIQHTIHSAAIQPWFDKTARRRRKMYLVLFPNKDVFCHYFDYLFYAMCRKMARSQSKRLRDETPDITPGEYECFVCHIRSPTCERSVLLPCCHHYVHRRCQSRWKQSHNTCGLCRAILLERDDYEAATERNDEAELARQEIPQNRPHIDTDQIARDVPNMKREEVITRLRTLIDSPTLEQQLERVRDNIPHFSCFLIERTS